MPLLPIIIVLVLIILGLVIYLLWEHYHRGKQAAITEQNLSVETAYKIIDLAIQKSRDLLNAAELESGKLVSDSKFYTQKIEKSYEEKLNQAVTEAQKEQASLNSEAVRQFATLEQTFKEHLDNLEGGAKGQMDALYQKISAAETNYEKFLQTLGASTQQAQFQSVETAKQKVDKLFEDFEVKLADFLLQSEQKMMLAVDLELRSARQLIDTYKVQQMNVIDENIMSMLEKTLSLVLAKNLDLKDQMDFVYESLEKAKGEKFVV